MVSVDNSKTSKYTKHRRHAQMGGAALLKGRYKEKAVLNRVTGSV